MQQQHHNTDYVETYLTLTKKRQTGIDVVRLIKCRGHAVGTLPVEISPLWGASTFWP